jgi:nucleoside-diphosphate-sugar epimerase
MKVLFLGGTGNLSTACARLAKERGLSLTILTRGLRAAEPLAGVEHVKGDASDPAVLEALASRRFDVVVSFIAFDEQDVRRDVRAFSGRLSQYVFISSASVYRKPPRHYVVTEDMPLANPHWDYARKKIAAEEALRDAHQTTGFPATIVRPCYTYGETWIPTTSGSDYTVAWRMRRGLEVVVPGDGTSLWTLTHASDFARGLLGLLGQTAAVGEAFHITSDEVLTWNQIHETIARVLGVEARIVHVPSDVIAMIDARRGASLLGDKAWSLVFDNSKLRRLVPDYRARVSFEDGIRASIAWFEAEPARQRIEANETVERILAGWRRAMAAFSEPRPQA